MTSSDLSSDSVSKPYPLLHSIVVVPKLRLVSIRTLTLSINSNSLAFLTSETLFLIPPPKAAISLYECPCNLN